ncbi:MAG: DeoR/GlpR family DNA-binding transcription regulator [Actinomycetota bacterium]
MDSKARRALIADKLRISGEASIVLLAQEFGTSEMTIRRDLDALELEGLARRSRGGAISVQSRSFEPPILQRASHSFAAKNRIGQAAVSLLRKDETVIIDVGSTTQAMARLVSENLNLTVMTSSLLVASELSGKQNVRTIVSGGVVRSGELSLIGPRAVESYEDLNCDTAFIGVAGVSAVKGLTEYNLDDAAVKRAAMSASRRIVVLADATKLGTVALVTVAPILKIDVLITDATPDDPEIKLIANMGIEIMFVNPN